MKLVKISAIAFAMSAMLAGPVLAQGAPSDAQIRGGAQGMQGGASGSDPGVAGPKAGVHAKTGAKGTVGAAGGAHKGTPATPPGDPAAGGRGR